MKRIVPQYYIDKIEESRLELFKLADEWNLNRFQLNQLVNITHDMWVISHKKFDDYRARRREHGILTHRLGVARQALKDIATHRDDDVDRIPDMRDLAKTVLAEMKKIS